ncbi:CgeB family protein [Humibacter ginsenosidimutans]|uniref:CgeB family protein n=1 Tax=Humibacter ginsenosidimutans TaxID=2599293 RepID=UPI001FEEEC6D|nr:glycosyltransferase [Humibacter ginsenosidimutans]
MSPVFHGYWQAIAAGLAVHGHEVSTHCYDAGDRRARLRNAVAQRVSATRARHESAATDEAIAALRRMLPDAVLVVKGDALGSSWWDAVARSGARTAVWLYDELSRMRYSVETLRSVERVHSYSPHDVETLRTAGVAAANLPDGYDSFTPFQARRSEAVTFVGARYPGRVHSLRVLAARDIPVVAYGREWSRHPWDVARTGLWRSSGVPGRRDLPRADYYGVMAGSLATLNVHGDGHDGFSMRTFEASGVGGLQLIDRPDVARHYDVGSECLVFTSDDELVDHVEHARREPAWADRIRAAGRERTLAEHTLAHRMGEVQRQWA